MDSITQIVLGAAVGEVCLGRKLGNRAMIWGAVAGTIPDLDIIGNFFMDDLQALAFHRGISHSIFFAVVFSFLMAWLTTSIYTHNLHQRKWIRSGIIFSLVALLLSATYGAASIFQEAMGLTACVVASIVGLVITGFVYIKGKNTYIEIYPEPYKVSYKSWYNFFFWTIVTHSILDSFTAYGTQLLAPFSDYRVAWNTISVADPLYTVPFLFCLLKASRFNAIDSKRIKWNMLGIGLSSGYLLLTVFNHFHVRSIVEDTISREGIDAVRFTQNPSILNNILWSSTIETRDGYYMGLYGLLDEEPYFKLEYIDPQIHLMKTQYLNEEPMKTLRWFTKDYFGYIIRKDGRLQVNDYRYGRFGSSVDGENDFIFRYVLEEKEGGYQLGSAKKGPDNEARDDIIGDLVDRILER